MTNKPFIRSSSSPGISNLSSSPAFERVSSTTRRGSDGSQRASQRHVSSSQSVMAAPLPYWAAEGVPFVAHNLPSGEVQMLPVQATPGVQGMVPVMAAPGAPSQQTGKHIFCVFQSLHLLLLATDAQFDSGSSGFQLLITHSLPCSRFQGTSFGEE